MGSHTRPQMLSNLRRRRDYLTKWIETAPSDHRGLDYDKAEVAALNWALGILETLVEEDDPRTKRPRRERAEA